MQVERLADLEREHAELTEAEREWRERSASLAADLGGARSELKSAEAAMSAQLSSHEREVADLSGRLRAAEAGVEEGRGLRSELDGLREQVMRLVGRAGPGLVWTDPFVHLGGLCRAQYATMLADAATQIEALQESAAQQHAALGVATRRCSESEEMVSQHFTRPHTNHSKTSEPSRIDEAAHGPTLPSRRPPRGPCSALPRGALRR